MRIGLVRSGIFDPPSHYNGHFFCENSTFTKNNFCSPGIVPAKTLPFTLQRTFLPKTWHPFSIFFKARRISHFYNGQEKHKLGVCCEIYFLDSGRKKALPLLERERGISVDMRLERIASTAGVRTHRQNERFGLSPPRSFSYFGIIPKPLKQMLFSFCK